MKTLIIITCLIIISCGYPDYECKFGEDKETIYCEVQ